MGSLIDAAARGALATRVRLEMAKQGLTREALAELAGVKERTLGNLLAAEAVRDLTVAKVTRALGLDLETVLAEPARPLPDRLADARAAEAYGGYMLSAFEGYLGTYVAYRRVFSGRAELYRSVYEIDWDEALSRLRFLELQHYPGTANRAVESSHAGGVYISPHTGLIQLLTTFQGALRLVTLSRFRLGDSRLRGVTLTQSDRDTFFAPAVSAILLERLDGRRPLAELERLVGPVGPDDPVYATIDAELAAIEQASLHLRRPP